jgi:hypothetical protein
MKTDAKGIGSHPTPYNDEYETCERTLAELRVYVDDLDPATVTKQLGIQPTSSQKKGEVRTNSIGKQRTAKVGGWFLSSEGHVTSKDLRRHLDWLLVKLTPAADALRTLQQNPDVRMSVTCIWWSAGDGGPTLWPSQMRGLADLGLECGFELAFYGVDDEQGS